jgi:FHA domain
VSAICPNGHPSNADDYCDTCGTPIAPRSPGAGGTDSDRPPIGVTRSAAGEAEAVRAARPGDLRCPGCETGYASKDKFCEACGYDFTLGVEATVTSPSPPTVGGSVPELLDAPETRRWMAIVDADLAYYGWAGAAGVSFPDGCPERTFPVTGPTVSIGRRSDSRGIHPDIDLGGTPEDTGISREHALLERQDDGTYALIDRGSANGTFVNEETSPVTPGVTVTLKDGDRFYLGAWTRIVIRSQ